MLRNLFLLVVVVISMSLASPVVSNINTKALSLDHEAVEDFYQRHPDWTVDFQAYTPYHLDCFRRHYNFKEPAAAQQQDVSNYYMSLI